MRPDPMTRLACAALLAATVLGCAAPATRPDGAPDSRQRPVWPPPPAEPRIAYVRSIAAPADLGVTPSWLDRAANFLTGGNRGKEPFVKPFGIAFDEAGNLCVTDTGANVVYFFDLAAKSRQRFEGVGKRRFVAPVAVARKGGVFYVADAGLRSVLAFDGKGEPLFEIREGVERPAGLAIVGERLYVADAESHSVAVFDLRGKFLSRFGRRGLEPGEFNFPTHLAGDGDGRLYVTDSMNYRVQVFDAGGGFLNGIGSLGDGSGHFGRPKGVAVDGFGHVYVTDALYDNLQVFDESGRFLLDVGSAGSAEGEFWMPAGVAINRDNEIYVADSYNCRVQVFRYAGGP